MECPPTLTHPLSRSEVPTGRDQVWILTIVALGIIGIAQWVGPGSGVELLLLTPAVAAFALRGLVTRALPEVFAAAVIIPVAAVVGHEGHLEGTYFLISLASLYSAWHLGISPRSVGILLATVATPWFVANHLIPELHSGWEAWSSSAVFTFGLGLGLRKQGMVIAELERAREALAHQAVAEERRRIARELHDLAGHTLAAVLLHVTGARHVLRRDVEEADRALRDAEAVGRASLDQIRATVAALRTDERGTDAALPGSADLSSLVDEYRRAGLAIDLSIDPAAGALHGPLGTAVHRIAREALANVARHASTNRVDVRVELADGHVAITVTDRGRPAAAPPDRSVGHFGLLGMQERARALGGRLEAEPTSDGWRVAARIPLPAGVELQST